MPCVWGCRRMRFSVSGIGLRRVGVWVTWPRRGLVLGGASVVGCCSRVGRGRGWLFTGRLSLESHPWLADHAVLGVVLLPGTAFLELVLHAGGEVGCPVVRELVLQAPLVLEEGVAVQIQVVVGEPGEVGRTVGGCLLTCGWGWRDG